MTPADLRDIRGPVEIPPPWLGPALIVAAGALAALLAWLALRWWRRRRARPLPARSPEELALERLARARLLIDAARPREFAAAVSEAVRLYLEARFAEPAAHRTTEELLRDLARGRAPALAAQRDVLADFLAHCDLAKFAREPLDRRRMEAMHASARRLVEGLRPEPPAASRAA
jgi:DNA-binding FadR family transcriptional regulator